MLESQHLVDNSLNVKSRQSFSDLDSGQLRDLKNIRRQDGWSHDQARSNIQDGASTRSGRNTGEDWPEGNKHS